MTMPREPSIPPKIRKQIESAIKAKAKAKTLEAEAKRLNSGAKETLLPIMAAYGIKSYTLQGVGSTQMKTSNGSNISGPKLREVLLIEGISAAKVDFIISASSKSWSIEYVEFKEEK